MNSSINVFELFDFSSLHSDNEINKIKKYDKDILKLNKKLEEEYECGGICRPNLFFYSLSIDDFKPLEKNCMNDVSTLIYNESYTFLVYCFIVSVINLITFPLYFFIYKGPKEDVW